MSQKISILRTLIPSYIKLASLSMTVLMSFGLFVSVSKEVVGQTQTIHLDQKSAELEEAKRLYEEVVQLYEKGEYKQAIPLAERSLKIYEKVWGKEHPFVASRLNYLARLYSDVGNYDKSKPLLLRSLAIYKKIMGGSRYLDTATRLHNAAELNQVYMSYKKVMSLIDKVQETSEKQQHQETSVRQNSFNNMFADAVRSQTQRISDKKSLQIFNFTQGLQMAKFSFELVLNHIQGREHIYKRSPSAEEKMMLQHPPVAINLNMTALMHQFQGSYERAEPLFKRSLAITEKALGKEHLSVATNLDYLALLYQNMKKYREAKLLYKRSLTILEKQLGREHHLVALSLNNLAELYWEQRIYNKAEPLLERSLAITEKTLGKEHPQTVISINKLAVLYDERGSYGEAIKMYKRSLAISEKTDVKQSPFISLGINKLAELSWAQDDITDAINFYHRQLGIEEQNIKFIFVSNSEQGKLNQVETFTDTTNSIISLSLEQASNNAKAAQTALTTVLRRKGRVLDAVADITQILRTQLKDNHQVKKLFNEWLDVQQQLSALVYKKETEEKSAQYKTKYEQLKAKREELEHMISLKSSEFRTEFKSVELVAVQQKIPKNTALVEIVQYRPFDVKAKNYGNPRYAAAILRNSGYPKWVDLADAATINKSVYKLRKALASKTSDNRSIFEIDVKIPQKSLRQLARDLDEQVMAPIRPHLGNANHILLSPDGQLSLIPFEALQDEKGKYLIENYAFSYLTSGRDLLRFDSSAPNNSIPVVFADINYDEKQTIASATRGSKNRRSTDLASLTFQPLAATLEEAQQIKSIFNNTKVFSQKQATETALKSLQAPSILHLATHGFFLPDNKELPSNNGLITNKLDKPPQAVGVENPLLRSGIALAGFNNRNQVPATSNDGVFTALEFAGLNLRGTQLVVLSACETGLGDVKVGEGLYGLRRALVIAGSQSQVLSLWKVSDEGTKNLMVKYYQNLKAGKGRHQALREVQLEFLKNPKYQHPYYWAAFVPSGNWTPLK